MTIKDIAKMCNVGISTVSRAINDDPGINQETKKRILKVIEEQNFVPNKSARNLKMTEAKTIALLIKGTNNPFFQGMLRIFEQELQKVEYSYLVYPVADDQDETAIAMELVQERRLKGIIFLGGLTEVSEVSLDKIGVPCVRCTVSNPSISVGTKDYAVSIDDRKEAYKAVDYLCKCGHKDIAIVCGREDDCSIGRMRQEGYMDALLDHGISYDPQLVLYVKGEVCEFSAQNGYSTVKALLESDKKVTAIFLISDMMAFGAYKAIKEKGLRIPEDISVIGFDGLDLTRFYHPSLTTVRQPCDQMVKASIEVLLGAINDGNTGEQRIFPAELIVRESVRNIE
ncbi:LacI family DNA-binding transcriptional regulator [Roseburia sp. 831b]|uniref:LacI family DNA-binding transcriptional regulator n=1 Tax=Roseburia sp. 831b TaxID=1261635 RepID=UPI000950C693|nr:LacI family DNA-binding transcriptional regulator [Roseburia sp. 831b]WVK71821.1 LacI family DNA-binding transcriptional regulator [Roseburia sp. 831b]